MTKLEPLYAQKSEKFGQVCAVAARELGYGEVSTLSVEDRIRVEDEAKQYVEQWEETVEMKTNFTIRPITAFASSSGRVSRHLRKNPRRA
jgi:hypothetical protein